MSKTILLLTVFGTLALALGLGLGLGATAAQAAELPIDDVIDCHGGRGGRGPDLGGFFKDCAACNDPEADPVTKVAFLTCVEAKLAETKLTPEQQAAAYDRVVAMLDKMEGDFVLCPERPAPKPRHGVAIGLRQYYLECANCEEGGQVTLEAFVACVTDKVNGTELTDEQKAKIIGMAGKVPVNEGGYVLCPQEREPGGGRMPSPPGRGGRGGR